MKKLSKKIFLTVGIVGTLILGTVSPVFAREVEGDRPNSNDIVNNNNNNSDPGSSSNSSGAVFAGDCRTMLGLKSWDCNVNISNKDTLKSGIWQIAANIAEDIAVIAAYLVLGYVIYGGYLYILSSGDPGKIQTAKRTLTHAFIGLAIVMLAKLVIGTTSAVFGNGDNDPGLMVQNTINWVIGVSGVVSAIFIVYGGVGYMMSAGDPSKVQKAKQTLLYALIGMAIVALSATISAFVSNTINKAAYKLPNNTISKEVNETH